MAETGLGKRPDTKCVLVVDPDADHLSRLSEALSKGDVAYGLVTAGSGKAALEHLAREDIFLLIADSDIPDADGIDFFREVRSRFADVEIVLMSTGPEEDLKALCRRYHCLASFIKPIDPDRLRPLINDQYHLEGEGFAGTLKNIQLDDLIQMCCPSGVSLTIRVRRGKEEGTIFIDKGDIVHAVCEDIEGDEAFYRILGWRGGYFETLTARGVPKQTINNHFQYLIMEAARRADEQEGARIECADTEEAPVECVVQDRLRVMCVDDSPMMCKIMTQILMEDDDIEVVGTASNGEAALGMIDELKPDLIALDVNMPVMDGRTALKHIMIRNPCPVVIMSNPASTAQQSILEFLNLGAVDFVSKPVQNDRIELQQRKIRDRVRAAARARINTFSRVRVPKEQKVTGALQENPTCRRLVLINSGAGGHVELLNILSSLEGITDTAFVVLHTIPPSFGSAFAADLSRRCALDVIQIEKEHRVLGGTCFVGINGCPVEIDQKEGESIIRPDNSSGLSCSREFNYFELFLGSIASCFDGPVLTVLLSGADVVSTDGLTAIREQGGRIILRTLSSSIVPYSLEPVLESGLADQEADPDEIIQIIGRFSRGGDD